MPIVRKAGVPVMEVWRSTALEWDAHVGYGDCTHWCIPGVIERWLVPLQEILAARAVGRQTVAASAAVSCSPEASSNSGSSSTSSSPTGAGVPAPRPEAYASPSDQFTGSPGCDELKVPADLSLPSRRRRPSGLEPWTGDHLARAGTQIGGTRRGSNSRQEKDLRALGVFRPAQIRSDGWEGAIAASQHPANCSRYLLLEDDMLNSGFGMDMMLISFALLIAVQHQRVLLHAPGRQYIYAHFPNATSGRWCDRPPFTNDCMWEPLSHCDLPPAGAHELEIPIKTPSWRVLRDLYQKERSQALNQSSVPVVRIKLSMLHRSHSRLMSGFTSFARVAASRYFFRPRPWVVGVGSCILKQARVSARNFFSVFVRQSPEKEKELGDRLPNTGNYAAILRTLRREFNVSAIHVQSANPEAVAELINFGQREGFQVIHTRNPRSSNDTEGGRPVSVVGHVAWRDRSSQPVSFQPIADLRWYGAIDVDQTFGYHGSPRQ